MKVAIIPPSSYIGKWDISDIHLILAHKLKEDKKYYEGYKKVKGYKIVDNGAFEGRTTSFGEVVKLAEELGANEVQLPDYMYDYKRTYKEATKALEKYSDIKFKIQFVIQGKNFEEFKKAVDFAMNNNFVLGIPFLPSKKVFKKEFAPREPLLAWIAKEYGEDSLKNVHLLGCNDVFEFHSYLYQRCRSMDTTFPIKLGIFKKKLPTLEDVSRPENYFDINNLSKEQIDYIIHNVTYIKQVIKNAETYVL